nr:hypothetical protein [Lysinibacillus timonensis]
MLTKIIQTYQDKKLQVISKFSDANYDVLEEAYFLDDGYIRGKMTLLKQEYKRLEKEIELLIQYDKKDDYNKMKIKALIEEKDATLMSMAFLSSNSFNSLDFAIQCIQHVKTNFSLCLEALYHFKENKEELAFECFEKYFTIHSEPLPHYLINKVYGSLLMEKSMLKQATIFLRKAVETKPEDKALHNKLIQIYETNDDVDQASVHRTILTLLGSDE